MFASSATPTLTPGASAFALGFPHPNCAPPGRFVRCGASGGSGLGADSCRPLRKFTTSLALQGAVHFW